MTPREFAARELERMARVFVAKRNDLDSYHSHGMHCMADAYNSAAVALRKRARELRKEGKR